MIAFPIIQTAVYEITNRFSIYGKWFPVYCRLDEMIPLVKWFIIPYLFWFLYIFGTVILLLIKDRTELKRMIKYFIFAAFASYPVVIFYPTTLPLRPGAVSGNDVLSKLLNFIFLADNCNTIFPSFHVIFAMGPTFALSRTKYFSSRAWKAVLIVITVLISMSTFMIKQHSVLDVIGALPFCVIGWLAAYAGAEKTSEVLG